MSRAAFILAATFLMAPAWTAAQEWSTARTDDAQQDIIAAFASGDDVSVGEDHRIGFASTQKTQPLDPWVRSSSLPVIPVGMTKQVLESPEAISPDSDRGHQYGEYFAGAAPDSSNNCCRQCGMGSTVGSCYQTDDLGGWVCDGCGCDVFGKPTTGFEGAFRLGYWGVQSEGSPVKVGEYQDLSSSPFWDLDGIWTNGSRTFDYTFSGLDQEANDLRAYYYGGPELSVDFDYVRFPHQLDHLPLSAYDLNNGPPGPGDKVVGEDLNVGEDYAIRVQQLDARFKGQLTKNLKWKVDLWGMRKSGERQANAMAHCFNVSPPSAGANYTCHVLSQKQNIDWTTMEVKPALEFNVGNAVVEYSRTMRAFGQNDQVVDRTYTFDFTPSFGTQGPPFNYAWVPESFTQIDRLKLSVPLGEENQLYSQLYVGDTENKFRGTHRGFYGYDIRVTNRAIDDVTLTAYAKQDEQNNEIPTSFLTTPPFGVNTGPTDSFEPGSLRHPIEYNNSRVGLKGKWQSPARNRLSVVGGYEYIQLARDYADYDTLSGPFTQEDTETHQINIGPYLRVTPTLDTFIRYKARFTNDPLIGVREEDGKFNTNQPEQQHLVELGSTWSPTSNFMVTTLFGIENSWHNSEYADFNEDNYPILFTVWYAPSTRFSLTTGYAYLSNWIDQDITIGFQDNPTETTQWNYGGYNHLFNISGNYAYSATTQLVGGFEWDRGSNVFTVPPSPAGANWALLPSFSDVIVETTRINVGVDHEFTPAMNAYFRYVYFDYDDRSAGIDSGTANMFLAGVTVLR